MLFKCYLIVLWFLIVGTNFITPAVMHSHSLPNNNKKEREEDGAYSPRDRSHVSESGEHHSDFDHEAILGSVKEAEEFDQLSPEESKRRLLILLEKMDLNGDKQIDRKELKAWILRSFKMLSQEESQERFEDTDENNDGKISWEEYLEDAYGLDHSKEDNLLDSEYAELVADDRIMWKAADTNGDGILDSVEWVAFSHPEEHPAMLPLILQQTLRDKDKDNDEALSFQEYIGDRGENRDKEWLYVEKEKFDHELDKDGDGLLKGAEILSWVVPSNEEIADEETQHLFSSSDDDQDDNLSFNEVLDHHDIFVGSEATDYGDHLHNIHQFKDEL